MKKRVLSLILALVLCVGLLPVTASAIETANARQTISKLPDNPGRPVLIDVTETEFWPPDTYTQPWTCPVSRQEVFSQIEKLTCELIKGKTSDTDKAKAIFDWVAKNITYDYESLAKKKYVLEAEDAFYTFYRRTGVCNGYANLVSLMDIIAGLPSVYILGKEAKKYHAWNAVYADGRFICFDATWDDWDVDPYSYHDSIEEINVTGELRYCIYSSTCELNLISQKGYALPKNLVIPDCVDVLDGNAFLFRTELESVVIPKNVQRISTVFGDCPNLKSVTFEGGPDSKLTLVDGFSRCTSLTEIVIPDGVTSIRNFRECTNLRSIKLPDSVEEIDRSTFLECTSLQSITLPKRLKEIQPGLFSGCSGLKSITIPDSVTKMDLTAFYNCTSLESLYIPSSVTDIRYLYQDPYGNVLNVVIYTEPGSYAETYAKEHNLKVVTSGMPTPTPAEGATPSGWAQSEVNEAIQSALVPADLRASYTSAITRNDFCRLMVALVEADTGKDIASYVTSRGKEMSAPFTDTSANEVTAAYALGIVNGTSATTFNPSGSITRQEAAAMLERTAKLLGMSSGSGVSFSDSGSIASWATGSVAFVSGLTDPVTGGKVMGGVGGNNFDPGGTYTREQAIATSLRLFHCAA